MIRVSRPLLALALVVTLAGCAPDAADGTQRVEIEGVVTEVTASSGDGRSYLLDVPGEGFLAIAVRDGRPPPSSQGVIVEMPGDEEIPEDPTARFAALTAIVNKTGEPLEVVGYLD